MAPLIHPDCDNPEGELDGWLRRLAREARERGVSDDVIADRLRVRAIKIEKGDR